MAFMRPAPEAQPSPRRASQEWFVATAYTGLVPLSGKPPLGKRGPKSGKRENAAAAIRQDLSEEVLTVESLSAMPEKQLAHRYGVSRDTVRKARHDVLAVAISTSPNDK